ncbi:arabinogalactan protein 1 [Fopius arisanus]|uniref:Arabinogalactan protein 1 n=1 Tax=Fopius arisanus TaxID=64838 RepID=A0A0C9RLH6_9HYME|nr:PREDICTED: arabinogalactan protein 1-like [Fopius arisanus]
MADVSATQTGVEYPATAPRSARSAVSPSTSPMLVAPSQFQPASPTAPPHAAPAVLSATSLEKGASEIAEDEKQNVSTTEAEVSATPSELVSPATPPPPTTSVASPLLSSVLVLPSSPTPPPSAAPALLPAASLEEGASEIA